MKFSFTLLYFLLMFSFASTAQNITGIWKGYFVQSNLGFSEERYKFEVQIEQLPNSGINGVTYSYKTTVFYGKAEAKGIYTKKTNNILLNEIKLVDLKISDLSQPCLMTCYLEYDKAADIETLTGTYSSRNAKNNGDCGVGKVYLEKATESDFYKEDFLVKREQELKKKDKSKVARRSTTKKPGVKPGAESNLIPKPSSGNKPTAKLSSPKKEVKPKRRSEKPLANTKRKEVAPPDIIQQHEKDSITVAPPAPITRRLPKPEVLIKRDNDLVKTITTSAKEFKIELYDNGEIDGDRISVYHNNELIVSNKKLTDKPISFTIKADEASPLHEFVLVAENLGTIPPNTALMIVTAGEKRYELFVTSTEQKNAVVKIEYRKD